jgi:FAD/FMN-containing dehydrogenase
MLPGGVLNPAATGWERLAERVAAELPVGDVDAVWVFRALRNEGREWGTAVISRMEGDRRRIYTARFALTQKGKERGRFEATVAEIGSGPLDAVAELIAGVRRRMDDEVPQAVDPVRWFAHVPAPETPAQPDGSTHSG